MAIAKNLKIGDKFTDGGLIYEVVGLSEYGYSSKCVGRENEKPIAKTEVKIEVAKNDNEEKIKYEELTKTDVNRTPKDKLEIMCKELGLNLGTTSEMKTEIIAKLGL